MGIAAENPAVSLAEPTRTGLSAKLERNVFSVSVLAVCFVVHVIVVRGLVQYDAWYTLLGGRIVSRSGLPHRDTLTVMTLGRTWVDQQWLAHLGLYGLWAAGGWPLAATAVVLMFTGAYAVCAVTARALGASDRATALVLALAFVVGLPNTIFRAQIPAYVLFAAVLGLALADARRASRRVYLVFPVLCLWANIHGSVVLGAGLVSLLGLTYLASSLRARRPARAWAPRALVLVLLPWLCTLASPYGLALPGYYRSVLDNPTLSNSISEWAPSTVRAEPFFFALLLGGLVLGVAARRRLTTFGLLAFAACGLAGLLAVRNEVWLALASAAILPAAVDGIWAPSAAPRRAAVNVVLAMVALAAAAIALVSVSLHGRGWFERDYPQGAVTAVAAAARSRPSTRIFADERYADWLLFEDPSLAGRVAYDVRFELLPASALKKIVAFRTEHGLNWQRAADGYGLLVLDPSSDTGAIAYFEGKAGTKVLFRDKQVVVLRRRVV